MEAIRSKIATIGNAGYWQFILPLPLLAVPLLWILAFYLGVDDRQITYFLTLAVRAALVALFFVLGLSLISTEKGLGPTGAALVLVLGFFAVGFFYAMVIHGPQPRIWKTAGQFFLSAVPALIAGIYCAKKQAGSDLLRWIERIGLILLPAAIIYVWRFFAFTDEIYTLDLRRLGRIDYMSLAYGFIPLMAASGLLLFDEKSPRRWVVGRWILVCAYWLAIVFTQTRGAVLGGFLFLFLLAIVQFKQHKKDALILVASCALIFAASIPILPKLFGDANARFSAANLDQAFSFTGGAIEGAGMSGRQFLPANENEANSSFPTVNVDEAINFAGEATKGAGMNGRQFLLANENNGVLIDRSKNICTIHNKEMAKMISVDEGFYIFIKESDCIIKLSRMALLVISFEEIKKTPWFGMGPLAFPLRYFGFHPHNLLIELVVELGAVLGGLVVIGLIWLGYGLVLQIRRGGGQSAVPFLAVIHLPMLMVSGTIWGDAVFSFLLGYLLVLALSDWRKYYEMDGPKAANSA